MQTHVNALIALVTLGVGALILWSNPGRRVNRSVCFFSCHMAAWLGAVQMLSSSGGNFFWVRAACAIGAFFPLHLWRVQEVIACGDGFSFARSFRRSWLWMLGGAVLALACFSPGFIPIYAGRVHRVVGWGYDCYLVGSVGLYVGFFFQSSRRIASLEGIRRMELEFWVVGFAALLGTLLLKLILIQFFRHLSYLHLQAFLFILFYTGTVAAIITRRIFDAYQVLRVVLHWLLLALWVGGAAYATFWVCASFFFPGPWTALPTAAAALIAAGAARRWLDRKFQFYPEARVARQAALAATQSELRLDRLEAAFIKILEGWGRTDHALVLIGSGEPATDGPTDPNEVEAVRAALRRLRWVTPERLARDRTAKEGEVLGRFLADRRLGVAVLSESERLSVIIGAGVPVSRQPFTYPQVTQLFELASIMEGAFERSLLSTRVHQSEQLATVGLFGASLAHEIRNPLVSIKAIVQLLPTRYNDPVFREKFFQLIGDEVVRIDRLTGQLLDLASPRAYVAKQIELHAVLRAGLELVAPKAAEKRVRVLANLQASPDWASADPAAVKQVVLNLCFNAIQAMEGKAETERWIKIETRNLPAGIELAVSDNGPGISSAMWARLFQPFQTTKSSGFGLGLTICRDILVGLKATIAADPPAPGRGATFRVTFSCQSSLS